MANLLHYEDIVTSIVDIHRLLYEEFQIASVLRVGFRMGVNYKCILLLR
jgi:hypothetical protein